MRHASQDKIGIYLVAANRLLREALARVLCEESGFPILLALAHRDQTREMPCSASDATVVLLDDFGAARSDLRLTATLMAAAPSIKVVLLGMPETEGAFLDSVRAGAIGYVLRDASAEVLISVGARRNEWRGRLPGANDCLVVQILSRRAESPAQILRTKTNKLHIP